MTDLLRAAELAPILFEGWMANGIGEQAQALAAAAAAVLV